MQSNYNSTLELIVENSNKCLPNLLKEVNFKRRRCRHHFVSTYNSEILLYERKTTVVKLFIFLKTSRILRRSTRRICAFSKLFFYLRMTAPFIWSRIDSKLENKNNRFLYLLRLRKPMIYFYYDSVQANGRISQTST